MTAKVSACKFCLRNKPDKECHIWRMYGRPEKILNCDRFVDARKGQ